MKKSKTDISDDVELNEAHNKKMQKIKEARDKMMSGKTKEKGLIIVHTGAGKGKSSSGSVSYTHLTLPTIYSV